MSGRGQVNRNVAIAVLQNRTIPAILKDIIDIPVDTRELSQFALLFEAVMLNIIQRARRYSLFFGRQRPNSIDFLEALTDLKVDFGELLQFATSSKGLEVPSTKLMLEKPIKTSHTIFDIGKGVWTFTEKPKYVFDYMPQFPPSHTFKKTPVKGRREEDKGVLSVQKLDQIHSMERNLQKILKASKALPEFANFC